MIEPLELEYEGEWKTFRYLLDDGSLVDVQTAHDSNSTERLWVVKEVKRLTKKNVKIVGIVEMKEPEPDPEPEPEEPRRGLFAEREK